MLWNDLRYALRLMRRSPGFTGMAVLSLALGIGANTAIYSLFYTIMLRPLAVAHPEQLVELVRNTPTDHHWAGYWSWDQYAFFRDHNHVFSSMTGMGFDNLAPLRLEGSEPETLIAESVAENYFQTLGLRPAIGRLPGPEDHRANGDGDVALVSWSHWNRHFHRDPQILGQRIYYHDQPKTIVGVVPREYVGPRVGSRTDLWIPANRFGLTMIARLKPGVTLARAQAEIDALLQASPVTLSKKPARMELMPAGAGLVRVQDQYGKPLVLLLGVVGLLLLLACINMASMLLARSAGRQHEIAVRVGLGAPRSRLVRQMLTESVLLSVAGTVASVAVAWFGVGVLVRILASSRAFEHIDIDVRPDLHLLLFTSAAALVTGLLFGLAPAWYAFRAAPAASLRQRGNSGEQWFWRMFGRGLVAAQVALSILLVTAAAVFLENLERLRHFNLGFRADHILLVTVDLSSSGYGATQLPGRYRELLDKMEAIPGVRSATVSGCYPLEGCGFGGRYLIPEGRAIRREDRRPTPIVFAGPRYFETLGVPLIAGRDFSFQDAGRPRVAIINQAMARLYFGGANPVGKHITVDRDPKTGGWPGNDEPYEIVGLAGDLKAIELRDPVYPTIYFNFFQEQQERFLLDRFELRTNVNPESLNEPVRRLVRDVLKTAPVKRFSTMSAEVDSNIVPERLIATLSEYFGCLSAVLAGVGLYGLLAYTVARRTNEIGIRMALGATAGDVSRLVARDALGMVCAGLAAGALLVFWTRPVVSRLVADLKPESVAPLAIAGAAILLVAVLASYIPALRAARLDPMIALRHE
jgi:predicted permease